MRNYVLSLLGFLLTFQVLLGWHVSYTSNKISFGSLSYVYEKCLMNGCEIIGWAKDLQENEVFLYQSAARNFDEYIQELSQEYPNFNKVYENLSKSEQKLFKSYYANTLKLYIKAKCMKRLDWNKLEQEIINFLTPYEALAEKFIQQECFVFDVIVGTERTSWRVGYDYKWPNGFGIISSKDKDISVCSDTPKTIDEYMTILFKNAFFVKAYQSLFDDEKEEFQKFIVDALNVYYKVGSGLLNHMQFQDEVHKLLQPYFDLANKFARQGCLAFILTVMSNNSVMSVGYYDNCQGKLNILCKINSLKE